MPKKNVKEVDYARPGKPMSHEDFIAMVREAEKGPFYPVSVLKKDIERWKRKKLKSK